MEILRDLAKVILYISIFVLIILFVSLIYSFTQDYQAGALGIMFSLGYIAIDLPIIFLCLGLVYKKLIFYIISLLFLLGLGFGAIYLFLM